MSGRRGWIAFALVAVAVAVLVLASQVGRAVPGLRAAAGASGTTPPAAATTAAAAADADPPPLSAEEQLASVPTPVVALPGPVSGQAAVDALGEHLPEVAAAHGMTDDELTRVLTTDASARIDPSLRLYHVEPALSAAELVRAAALSGPTTAQAPPDVFALHSRPGATKVIYLDVDGHTTTGTGWNNQPPPLSTGSTIVSTGYTLDGDATTFTTFEQSEIWSMWARVAEDYAPFDVDVTTADPGTAAIDRSNAADQTYGTRVVIAGTNPIGAGCVCGGVAFVGVFDDYPTPTTAAHDFYQPAFVFQQNLGGSSATAKTLAEAASHEAGHTLGLEHDGNATSPYHQGNSLWAPIMGTAYFSPVSQWSRGEYTGANNLQDDLAVIASHGPAVIADDHANTRSAATPISGPTTALITSATDTDWFRFTTAGDPAATITATPARVSPDLDIRLTLYDASGVQLATSDPPSSPTNTVYDVASGLDASITATLPGGTYFVAVKGTGSGTAASTGYSSYASIGQFTLDVGATSTPVCVAAPPGTVGWWRGEGSGAAQVGPALSGTTSFAAGEVGTGFSPGSSSSMTIAGFPAVTNALTVEAWVRPTPGTGRVATLLSRWTWRSGVDDDVFALLLGPNGELGWLVDEPSTLYPEPAIGRAPQLFDGSFHHLAATFDRGVLTIDVDGEFVGTTTTRVDALTTATAAPFQLFVPGSFTGVIDEPTVYDRALSPGEITSVYLAGSAGKCTA